MASFITAQAVYGLLDVAECEAGTGSQAPALAEKCHSRKADL